MGRADGVKGVGTSSWRLGGGRGVGYGTVEVDRERDKVWTVKKRLKNKFLKNEQGTGRSVNLFQRKYLQM